MTDHDQVNYLHTLIKQLKYRFASFYSSSSHHDKAQIPQAFSGRKSDNLAVTFRLVNKTVAAMLFQVNTGCCCGAMLRFKLLLENCASSFFFFFYYLLSGCIVQDSKLNIRRYISCDPLKLYESSHCWCQLVFSHILFSASWEVASCWKVPTTWPGKSVWLQLCSFLQ